MTRLGSATALLAILPDKVVSQFLEIWEGRENCQVTMDFGGGRCVGMRVTRAQRFSGDDFPVDTVVGKD